MAVNRREFFLNFDKVVAESKAKQFDAVRLMALKLFQGIVLKTPVDTGRARGNWQIGSMTPPRGVNDRTTDPTAQESSALDNYVGQPFYFVNNLPYIQKLENGSSMQAPTGMVRTTLTEFEKALRQAARQNKI